MEEITTIGLDIAKSGLANDALWAETDGPYAQSSDGQWKPSSAAQRPTWTSIGEGLGSWIDCIAQATTTARSPMGQ